MIYDLWFILYMLYDVVHVRYEMKGYMIYGIRICVYIYIYVCGISYTRYRIYSYIVLSLSVGFGFRV